ncbi:MAG: Colicin I receptor precursor [Acidobacteria bacterium ADurb.Bin340]|nr:MAG: Colicin I receptor precursor [Acidobacteria bacterium ADurb.Bin340]
MRKSVLFLALVAGPLCAQQPTTVEDDLLALLNTPVTVASKKAMTTREAPGIVTLITRDDILASGARDLKEVLNTLAPGFQFGADVQSVVGIAVRGAWAHEGKVLLLIDGQEMNETKYANSPFGGHFPIDQIARIEIIRGPGSAMYGGFAELGVINVITRNGKELRGASASLSYGTNRKYASVAYGATAKDVVFSLALTGGDGNRSNRDWIANDGSVTELKSHSDLKPFNFNAGLQWKGLEVRAIYDRYLLDDFYGGSGAGAEEGPGLSAPMLFSTAAVEVKYAWAINDKWTVTPRVSHKRQLAWQYTDRPTASDRALDRDVAGVQVAWDPTQAISIVTGFERTQDTGKDRIPGSVFVNGKDRVVYLSNAYYAQGLLTSDLGNFTVGARFEDPSFTDSSFVPRFAYTKVFGDWSVKILAAKAFRAPVLGNIEFTPLVKPETTTTYEAEVGYQATKRLYVSGNLFVTKIKDAMIYPYTGGGDGGTKGVEIDAQYRAEWGSLRANATLSRPDNNKVLDFQVPETDSYLLGMANEKANITASVKLGHGLSLAPTLSYLGKRYGYAPLATDPITYDAEVTGNLFLRWQSPIAGLEVGAGVYNVSDTKVYFIQAYNGGGTPIPGAGREFSTRVAWRF